MQKECLFQRAEELLVWARLFDGLQVELRTGPDDELGIPAGADRGGEAHEITAVPEWAPCIETACKEEECIRAIEKVGRVRDVGLLDIDKFLSGDDSQLFIQHFHVKVQILHGGNDGLKHPPAVRGVKGSGLCSPNLELACL